MAQACHVVRTLFLWHLQTVIVLCNLDRGEDGALWSRHGGQRCAGSMQRRAGATVGSRRSVQVPRWTAGRRRHWALGRASMSACCPCTVCVQSAMRPRHIHGRKRREHERVARRMGPGLTVGSVDVCGGPGRRRDARARYGQLPVTPDQRPAAVMCAGGHPRAC
jgi:hypothetical protein